MLFLMKMVKFSASIMIGLWVRMATQLSRRGETGAFLSNIFVCVWGELLKGDIL